MTFLQNDLGYFYQSHRCFIFFGKANATAEDLKKKYSQFYFQKVKQTHSDILVEASNQVVEADAHWTSEKNTALLIATADCVPLMIMCNQTQRIAAVHAGWKGVVNQITSKTLQQLVSTGSTKKDFNFWFGPRILQNSFEVSEDVFLELEKSQYGLNRDAYSYQKSDKYFVDLQKIILSQIQFVIDEKPVFDSLDLDTKTNSDLNSYRRGKQTSARNLSFIVCL